MSPVVENFREKTEEFLSILAAEIASKQAELDQLNRQFVAIRQTMGVAPAVKKESEVMTHKPAVARARIESRPLRRHKTKEKKDRIDWQNILTQLPEHFTSKDVIRVSSSTAPYVATRIYHWQKEQKIQRVERGQYKKN